MNLQIEIEKRNLGKATKEMDEYHRYIKAKENYKKQKNIRIEKKRELLALKAKAESTLKNAQQAEQVSLLRKQEGEEAMRQAEALKKSNSEAEINIVLPGRAELGKLTEQKMDLAKQIAEFSKNSEKEELKEREALAAKQEAKKDAIEQTQQLELAYKAKQEEKEAIIRVHQEFIQSYKDQISSQQTLVEQFTEKYEIESEAYKQRLAEARKQMSEKFLRHAEEKKRSVDALMFKREVLEQAIFLIKDTEKAEREANAECWLPD